MRLEGARPAFLEAGIALATEDRAAFRLQITASDKFIRRAERTLDTRVLKEAMRVVDRMALACRRAAPPPSRGASRTWVVSAMGEAGLPRSRAPAA